jgi:hypothetical protein
VSTGSCEFCVESVLVLNGHLEEVASALVFLKSNDRTLNTAHINNLPASANIIQTVPDMKVRGQLACLEDKHKHKKKSCKLYICPLYILCRAPMMFTCIKVLRPLIVKGGLYG